MIKRDEKGMLREQGITVEELIKELSNYNPKAKVKMHISSYNFKIGQDRGKGVDYILSDEDASGITSHSFIEKQKWNDDEVWIYSVGLI